MVREYRERALARRLDRDGARLEQYTKKQKQIPIGDAVAVQNQTGRFPKKWDKTGVVIENMDHDKVLVRMDGSRRLTTRNRRFVKKILSPPDVPDQGIPDDQLLPVQRAISGPVVGAAEDDVPTVVGDADTSDMQEATGLYQSDLGSQIIDDGAQSTDNMQNGGVGLNVQPLSPVPSCSEVPAVGRPKRDRRPNVKYRSDEYDLSKVSAAKKTLRLSGLHAKQCRPMDRGRC